MTDKFQLPGAETFSQYLEETLEGTLTAEGPKIFSDKGKRWIVFLDGEQLGVYETFDSESGETDFYKGFSGRIPGYVNECILINNKGKPKSEKMPEDLVRLSYSNQKFEEQLYPEHGRFVDTPWQRQDGCEIPFP